MIDWIRSAITAAATAMKYRYSRVTPLIFANGMKEQLLPSSSAKYLVPSL